MDIVKLVKTAYLSMSNLIDKDALVAEIERRKHKLLDHIICESDKEWVVRTAHQLNRIILFLDALEVKEVDLKEEIKEDWLFADKTEVDCLECMCLTEDMFVSLAKKYFALGLKAQKGEEV